ncbi:MFS general substrate transporter [Saccharata proteae CBS 121410]|uniref:MFS general substrate transporter n=1 Tax=Saccharata proteae CBS 121410 TaxID=1314787 RepID=A0A9P4HZQ0_9PEZI|nr:MFS general substrate transporter [Saccharata proteae CBS 121410]
MRLHTLRELDQTEGTHICFFAVCAFTFLTNYAIGGLAPAFFILSKEFGKSMTETSDLLLWPVLVLGLFNFFWVPLANYFGKRPVFVCATLVLCVAYIWGAFAHSFESLLWSNILAAAAGSSTEALGAATVNDLYFLHERGSKMGLYMSSISGGNTIGPLVCGFVVETIGWRWHKGIAAIAVGINFLLVVFFVPETSYDRESVQSSSSPPIASSGAGKSGINDEEAVPEKNIDAAGHEVAGSPRSSTVQLPVPKKTFMQELSLLSGGSDSSIPLWKLFIRPFPLIVYPAIIFAFLGYAVSLAWTVAINILNSFILQAPPYSFSPAINGLINIPGLLGNLVGAWCGGWLVDRFADWRSKKHGGIFRPESRLPLLIIPAVIVPAGCILFGYGVERSLSWVSLFFGYGMISVGLTAVPVPTMVYVSDCYLPVAADALVLVNGLKNIVAFGFLYGIVPWVDRVGYIDCFGTQAGVYVAIVVLGAVPLILFGEKIRHTTAKWRVILF